MHRIIAGAVLLTLVALCTPAQAVDRELVQRAHEALRSATVYLTEQVAYEGGYLGSYLADLSQGWGEGARGRTVNWVQPPGTPSMGMAYMDAWRATGDDLFLDAAVQTARALVRGQLEVGGWAYNIDHSPEGERRWFYRRNAGSDDPQLASGQNRATLDDDVTQSATRLLIAVDQALDTQDAAIHEAVMAAQEFVLRAQYGAGGWPQVYPLAGRGYSDYYTYNDGVHANCLETLMIAYRAYGDQRYFDAVVRGGEFILLSQLPEPHPVWAQQYDMDLQPAWARRMEPAAACAGESAGILRALVEVAVFTGDTRFLQPIPRAVTWYRRSMLDPGDERWTRDYQDGWWARFYELKTNRPLFQLSQERTAYWLSYDDHDQPDHYAFVGRWGRGVERVGEMAQQILALGPEEYERQRTREITHHQRLDRAGQMQDDVRRVLQDQDDQGRWVETIRGEQMIRLSTFQQNMRMLSSYLQDVYGH